jgi:hypothetical protein
MDAKHIDAEYEFSLPLQNGEQAYFRPIKPADRQIIQEGLASLSEQTRHFRFFTPVLSLPDFLLDYLTNVDQHNHIAWIAFTKISRQAIGISRCIRQPNQPEIAEMAMVVVDKFQKIGLGTYLMALLYFMAAGKGVKILRCIVLTENKIMYQWLDQLGAISALEDHTFKMDLTVNSDFSLLPATAAGKKLREALEKIAVLTKQLSQ